MIYLLDTNAVTDLANQHPRAVSRLASVRGGNHIIVLLTIVEGELLFGIERLPQGARKQGLAARVADVFKGLTPAGVPESAGPQYASIKADCARRGIVLSDNDYWIAASAKVLSATIVTRDRDFTRVPGLLLEDWTQ